MPTLPIWRPLLSGARLVEVSGLFGVFDHAIAINDNSITIVHAPNGYGKTAILRLIDAFSKLRYLVLEETEYKKLSIHLHSQEVFEVERIVEEGAVGINPESEKVVRLVFRRKIGEKLQDTWEKVDPGLPEGISPSLIERFVPNLERVGVKSWRLLESRRSLNLEEVLEEFGHLLPEKLRQRTRPVWLSEFSKNFPVHLIETQRLLTLQSDGTRSYSARSEPQLVPVVKNYARQLGALIRNALTEYAAFSQSLDRSFPNRVLANLQQPAMKEGEIRAKLDELEQERKRLRASGFLEEEGRLVDTGPLGTTARRVLAVFVDDVQKKLAIFKDLLLKVESFTKILNSHFVFKSVKISKDEGFLFVDHNEKPLNLDLLSSGEQHELVLTYELLFKTPSGSLILVDEPEISLHVEWQLTFLDDLQQMIEKTKSKAIVCTHSPQIVNNRTDLMIQLSAPTLS